MHKAQKALWPIYLTVFLDLLGLGLIIPVFGPLFLDPAAGLLPIQYAHHIRTILLGFLIATYPLAQFFGAPVLGGLSDRHGRRPVLIFSILGTTLGYVVFALGVSFNLIPLLFLGRAIDGFTGGNISTALSAVSDVSTVKTKARNFGLVGVAVGAGFIFGPFIGGKLANPAVLPLFNFSTPFWVAAHLAGLNGLCIIWFFKETIQRRIQTTVNWLTGFKNIHRAFQIPDLRIVFIVIFLLSFGFNFFAQFFQVFLVDKFHFTEARIGDLFAYTGVWLVLAQGFLTRPLAHFFRHDQIVAFSSVALAVALIILLIPNQTWWIYVILPFVAIFEGLVQPNSTALISDLGHEDSQGEILGINQSIQSLAQAIPPLIAGFIAAIHASLPIIVASIATLAGWYMLVRYFRFPVGKIPAKTPVTIAQ